MSYAIAILALAALSGAWVLFQQWIARRMPDAPGIHRRCDGCDAREHCAHRCDRERDGAARPEQASP